MKKESKNGTTVKAKSVSKKTNLNDITSDELQIIDTAEDTEATPQDLEQSDTTEDTEATPQELEQSEIAEELEPLNEPSDKATPTIYNDSANKFKIKTLKRSLENKKYALERENIKVRDWRVQAVDRDNKAGFEYEKRKKELEDLLAKNQTRYDKRMAKTQKWWWEYCINHEATKIAKIQKDIILLANEINKLEGIEPIESISDKQAATQKIELENDEATTTEATIAPPTEPTIEPEPSLDTIQ